MHRSKEEETFDAYKRIPSSDHLSQLLSLHQGRAFNLCFQVLGRRENAEDAAQEALIKIVECMPRIENTTTFRSWLYRICLTHALDTKRGIRRRQTHESRFAMNSEASAPAPDYSADERRTALLQALERIEDDQRNLIVEHYFERTSLTQIATREGISHDAIWKRIERARRDLKQALVTMGTAAVVPDPSSLLEACHPSVLSTNLVPRIMAKVTAPTPGTTHDVPAELCKGSLTSATKALALGGFVMTVKQSTWTTVAIAAVCVLTLGLVIGLMSRAQDNPQGKSTVRSPQGPGKDKTATLPTPPGHASEPAAKSGEPTPGERKDPPTAGTPLKDFLAEYRKKIDEKFPDRTTMRKRYRALMGAHTGVEDEEALQYARQLGQWRTQQLAGLRDLVLSDPSSFLEFVNSSEAAGYLEDMFAAAFHNDSPFTKTDYSTLPTVLKDGLLALLQSGSSEQRTEILSLTANLDNIPRAFSDIARSLLFDADPEVQWAVLMYSKYNKEDARPYTKAEAGGLRTLAQSTSNSALASEAVWALARTGTPGFAEFAFSLAASPGSNMGGVTAALEMLLLECTKSTSSTAYEQRVINAICQCQNVRRWDDKQIQRYSQFLLGYSWLPIVNSLPAYFDQAAGHATSRDLAGRLTAVATAIRSGTTDHAALNRILDPATPPTSGSVPGE